MKQRSKIYACLLLTFLAVISFTVLQPKEKNKNYSDIDLAMVFENAVAGPEGCVGAPGKNTGQCRKSIDGTEYFCVDYSNISTSKNCYSD